jgi:prepilin-type N-terminal cleavage/methylation domain-containing protein
MMRHVIRRWERDARGLTLLELMTVLLIMSIVSGAVLTVFLTSLTTFTKGSVGTQVQQAGRIGVDRLSRDLRQARRLYSGTQGGFSFSLSCTQISFVLPHLALVPLSTSPSTSVYMTDADPVSGAIPYDGSYVSYYLAATPSGTTPSSTGPYLVRTAYAGATLSTVTVASNITALGFAVSGGGCPTTSARLLTVTVTAYQQANGVGVSSSNAVSSTDVVTLDITLRNQ